MDIARRIKELLDREGLNVNSFCDKTGIAQSTVQNLVKNKQRDPQLSTVESIAIGFGLTLAQFCDFDYTPELPFEARRELQEHYAYVLHKYEKHPGK